MQRVLAAFVAGAVIGGFSVGQIGKQGLTNAAAGGAAGGGAGGTFQPFQGGGSGGGFGFAGGGAATGTTGGGGAATGTTGAAGSPGSSGGLFGSSSGGSSSGGSPSGAFGGSSGGSGSGSSGGALSGSSSGGSPIAGGTSGGSSSASGTSGGSSSTGGTSGGSPSTGGATTNARTGGSGGSSTGGSSTSGGGTGGACSSAGNGGSTDRGVTATSIKLATTVVDSGIGQAFLGDVKFAMEAVRQRVNRAGGICGRSLDITYRDDGWAADTGAQYLRNFIQDGVFAIPVGPSSEGLNAVINSGDFDTSQTPVVGTDGMIISQYAKGSAAQPWVWPVAVATVGSARIIAKQAYDAGARSFSVVFDRNFKFGQEAANAFNSEVNALTGKQINGYNSSLTCQKGFCGIEAGQSSYSAQVNEWKGNRGDFTALFLEPQTALTWMNDANTPAATVQKYGASQTLFTRAFGDACKARCDQMRVWTGFKPAIEQYQNDPAVQQYVSDIRSVNPNADAFNQFVEGGYVGMRLLVDALVRVGPQLTRIRLQGALNSEVLQTGLTLTPQLQYSPDNRYVATSMQGWDIQYKGTFGGWRAGPIVTDPRPKAGSS